MFERADRAWLDDWMEKFKQSCPSIRYRLQKEIDRDLLALGDPVCLQAEILREPLVAKYIENQKMDGSFGSRFHTAGCLPEEVATEVVLRFLLEKGVEPRHPAIIRALDSLKNKDFARELFRIGRLLDEFNLGGSCLIRAALFAQAGREDPFVQEEVEKGLEVFHFVSRINSLSEVAEERGGFLAFRSGVRWPSIYHFRLFAYLKSWRTKETQKLLLRFFENLLRLSPLPSIRLYYRSQWIAPTTVYSLDFLARPSLCDGSGLMAWFLRNELLARMGVLGDLSPLNYQMDWLSEVLRHGGRELKKVKSHDSFMRWTAYTGLALEKDWKSPIRRLHDLAFRGLLILHYSGLL